MIGNHNYPRRSKFVYKISCHLNVIHQDQRKQIDSWWKNDTACPSALRQRYLVQCNTSRNPLSSKSRELQSPGTRTEDVKRKRVDAWRLKKSNNNIKYKLKLKSDHVLVLVTPTGLNRVLAPSWILNTTQDLIAKQRGRLCTCKLDPVSTCLLGVIIVIRRRPNSCAWAITIERNSIAVRRHWCSQTPDHCHPSSRSFCGGEWRWYLWLSNFEYNLPRRFLYSRKSSWSAISIVG